MRLLRFKLNGSYRSLQDFDQTFREPDGVRQSIEPICFVGLNGTGKSNVIEAISEVFCYLELKFLPYKSVPKKAKTSDLNFEIEYELPRDKRKGNRHILISTLDSKEPAFFEIIEGEKKEIDNIDNKLSALPSRVVGYSSGLNEVISVSFLRNQSYYSQEVREQAFYNRHSDPVIHTRTMYMDYESNAAIVLANYLFRPKNQLALFKRLLRIEDISSFRLGIQFKPPRKSRVKTTPEIDKYVESLRKCSMFYEKKKKWTDGLSIMK